MATLATGVPEPPRALPATEVLIGRIGWLIRLRWIAIAGTFLLLEIGRRLLPITVHRAYLYPVLAVLALYNGAAWLLLHWAERRYPPPPVAPLPEEQATRPGRLAAFLLPRSALGARHYDRRAGMAASVAAAQIGIDLCFLVVVLHLSGGIENPLWVFFVFHIIVSSVLLSRQATYLFASLGTLLLWGMIVGEHYGILAHYPLNAQWRVEAYLDRGLMWAHLLLQGITLFVAAYLASSIAGRLRRREADVMVLSLHLSELAQGLERANAELRSTEQAKSQYMRKVAHELRAPLATIKTALTVVLRSSAESMSAQTRHLIERAERRIGELSGMTASLLALSRAQVGRTVTELAPVPLGELAHAVADELEERAHAAQLRTSIAITDGLPIVLADGEGLTDLLENLTRNAVRYTPAGGGVGLRVDWREGKLRIDVWDTGIGIAEEDLPRIYDEFYRSRQAREFTAEGSGLGLAIVRAVVERHGGTIAVESRPGAGTRFHVELPLLLPAPVAAER